MPARSNTKEYIDYMAENEHSAERERVKALYGDRQITESQAEELRIEAMREQREKE